ncbi:MAG: hypothetical protein PHW18_00095 [Sulfuricurvum sp.]|uniref:hypothetical protein n=1 Tax=Sulfuricurvum sp. TaxID=2025608 RepID=UPI002618F3B1|nr:hypothetical protein [Sulfuricurvum sp.]MDD2827954.1 hypothetical protein [Sulfuricurvum sp.]MDD4948169.1 hypothetical protein [Sulfuricurvum sp.]
MSKILRVFFLIFLFLIDVYASSVPKLQVGSLYYDQVNLTPNHKLIIAISGINLEIWQTNDTRLLYREKLWHTHGIKFLIDQDNDRLFATIGYGFNVYDLKTLKLIASHNILPSAFYVSKMFLSASENKVYVDGEINRLEKCMVYDIASNTYFEEKDYKTCKKQQNFPTNTFDKSKLILLPAESYMTFGAGNDKAILVDDNRYIGWDLKEGREIWRNFTGWTQCKDCSPDPHVVAFHHTDRVIVTPAFEKYDVFEKDGMYALLNFDMGTGIYNYIPIKQTGSLAISSDDKRLAILSADGNGSIYEPNSMKYLSGFNGRHSEGGVGFFIRAKVEYNEHINDFMSNNPSFKHRYEIEQACINDRLELVQLFDHMFSVRDKSDQKQIAQFVSFKDGEWLIVTDEGYFNASSKKVLNNLNIFESVTRARGINDEEVKKYYRPDIVSALLQQKPLHDLETKEIKFVLPEKAVYINQYYPSLRAMYVNDKNPYSLASLAEEKNPKDLKLIKQAILDSNSSDIKSTLYRSLNNFDENETLSFVHEQLDKASSIDNQIVLLSLIKNIDIRVQKLSELLSKKLLSENTIIWFATWAREEDCQKFEPLLWQAVKKSLRIRNEVVLNYLMKKGPKRLEKIWVESAVKILKNSDDFDGILSLKNIIPYLYKLNPSKTIELLTDPQYKFNVYLFDYIQDPALTPVLFDHLIENGDLNSKVFNNLLSYKNQNINKKMIEKIIVMDCKKISKRLKQKIENDLNITLPCDKN